MAITNGIFGDKTSIKDRYVENHKMLRERVRLWKKLGLKIVLTSGTFDLFHVGHAKYLERAKSYGDLLIVGVDSDAKVRARKGPHRPIVPEQERVEILTHIRHVDVITLKGVRDSRDHLIKLVQPDVLVTSETTKHHKEDLQVKGKYCGRIVNLPAQSKTSTSAKVRLIHVRGAEAAGEKK